MEWFKHWVTHNWYLKLFALVLATMLWAVIASATLSEIGMEVPLEYRNIPAHMEITGDTENTVQVRLRGSENLIREIQPKDVSTTVDLTGMNLGEKIIALTRQNVQTPFGAEVVRVNPSRVRFTLERTLIKLVPVVATLQGEPADGFEIGAVSVNPSRVEVEGPESRVSTIEAIPTLPIDVDGKKSAVLQSTDLDVPDPDVRLQRSTGVAVQVEIRAK